MDEDLQTFLQQRLVSEETIEKMEKDKIDVSVIPLMGESDLAQYLPSYGDRVAVVAFCRKRDKDSRKEAIINRIKGRFLGEAQGSRGAAPSTSVGTRGTPWHGNKNGEKKERRLELGWMNYDFAEQRFKQVRAVKGGGTRSLTIERNTTVDEIRVLAESIFFPNGFFIQKKLSDYQTEIRDFAQCQLNSSSTVEELYEHTKVRLLRLYLCTKRKDPDQSFNSFTSKLPASQHSASQSPARRCHALEPLSSHCSVIEPPASQTFVLELPTSQCSANEPPTSQHLDVEPSTSQHFDLEPSNSQCYGFESPTSQHSALESPVYINAGTPEVFYRVLVNTTTINSTEMEDDLDATMPLNPQCSSPTTPQQQAGDKRADTAGDIPDDGPTCTSLSDILQDSDPEEEMQMLSSPPPDSPVSAEDGLCEILKDFRRENICEYTTLTVVVRRKRVLQSAINALGKSFFDWHKRPNIEFVGELAQDNGGPTREFFRLLMKEVGSFGVFEGQEGNLFFTYNQSALDRKCYYTAGKLTAWSLVHGGPGLGSLYPALFRMMCGLDADLQNFQCEVLPDRDVQEKLLKIQQCNTEQDWICLRPTLEDWIADCGVPEVYGAHVQNLPQIFGQVVRHFIFHRSAAMIQQFTEGMNSCGRLWDTVKRHWKAFKKVFTQEEGPLTRSAFRALFKVQWSDKGTNRRDAEEDTMFSWECLLNTIEEKQASLSFEDLLTFVTGADAVPPLGFHKQVEIQFFDQEYGTKRFPSASTCALILSLPRGVLSEEELTDILTDAVRGSQGFGIV